MVCGSTGRCERKKKFFEKKKSSLTFKETYYVRTRVCSPPPSSLYPMSISFVCRGCKNKIYLFQMLAFGFEVFERKSQGYLSSFVKFLSEKYLKVN